MKLTIHKGNVTTRIFVETKHNCLACDKEIELTILLHPAEIKELLENDKLDIEVETMCDDEHFNRWTTIFKNEFNETELQQLKEQA